MAQTLPRVPPARSPTLTVAVEELVVVGAVTPSWPTPPSGAVVTYEVVYEPEGSSAAVDAEGEITTDTEGMTIVQMDSTLLGNVVQRAVGVVYTPPSGEAPADLTLGAATDPEQSLASDATTATVEWPTASGGTSPYTYAISVKDEAGSSVTPNSGSANGPYVIPVAAGKSYAATLGVTDAAGQVARRTAMVHVAAETGTVGWVKTHDLDFAGITPVSQSSASGTGTLSGGDFDGLPYKWNRTSGSSGSIDITADGMKITGTASGGYEGYIDLSTLINASDSDDFVVAIFVRDIAGLNTSTTRGMRVGLSAAGSLSSGTNDGLKGNWTSGTNWTPNIMRNDTTTTSYGGTVTVPTEGRLTVRISNGVMAHSAWAAGVSSEPSTSDIAALFLHQISLAAKAADTYTTGLWVGATAYNGNDVVVEIYRVCIYEKGVA